MTVATIITAILFVLSSGLLFNERYRHNKTLMTISGILALIASYFLLEQMIEVVVSRRLPGPARPTSLEMIVDIFSSDFLKYLVAICTGAAATAAVIYFLYTRARVRSHNSPTNMPPRCCEWVM
jgi:hypothetical protein